MSRHFLFGSSEPCLPFHLTKANLGPDDKRPESRSIRCQRKTPTLCAIDPLEDTCQIKGRFSSKWKSLTCSLQPRTRRREKLPSPHIVVGMSVSSQSDVALSPATRTFILPSAFTGTRDIKNLMRWHRHSSLSLLPSQKLFLFTPHALTHSLTHSYLAGSFSSSNVSRGKRPSERHE